MIRLIANAALGWDFSGSKVNLCDKEGDPVAERPLMVAGRFNARDKPRILFRRVATVERVG